MTEEKQEQTWQTCVARRAKPYVRKMTCPGCSHRSECTPLKEKKE